MVNRQLGNFTSPISHHHSVPSNSPINIPFTDHLLPKADELNRALNDAIIKLSDPPNIPPTYGTEFKRKDNLRLQNQEINENFNFVKNSGLITKSYYGESPFKRKVCESKPKLNPEAKPFQSQNLFHYNPDIQEFNGILKPPQETQPLRSVKIEFEIKKLIKEMQELENNNKKSSSVGHGDEQIKKFGNQSNVMSIKNYPIQHLINNNNPLTIENCGISENLMTRKFCHIDLIKSQNQLDTKKATQVEGREEETKEEKEVHIINPDYSSSENDEDPKISSFNSPFFNVDLCLKSNSGGSLPDSGAKGDICQESLGVPVLNTIDTQGDIFTPEKKKSIDGLKTLPLCTSPSSTSKKGKKKKTFGQRILSFFGKNKSPTSSNHANCGIFKDTK